MAIPRQSFIAWPVAHDSLSTGVKLVNWGIYGRCALQVLQELLGSRDHLFFQCSFSRRMWKEIMSRNLIDNPSFKWEAIIEWGEKELKGGNLNRFYGSLVWVRLFIIFGSKNELKYGNQPKSAEKIVHRRLDLELWPQESFRCLMRICNYAEDEFSFWYVDCCRW